MTPSQRRLKAKGRHKRLIRDHYDETSVRNAVYRACDRAFPLPDHLSRRKLEGKKIRLESPKAWRERLSEAERLEVQEWRRSHRWHPNQLRHNHATDVRRKFGLEPSQVALGHSKADVTQVSAERDTELAVRVAAAMG
jgi:hypothetical protein